MNDSMHSGLEPGPLPASSDTSSGAHSEPALIDATSLRVRFAFLGAAKGAEGVHPTNLEASWSDLVASLSVFDYRSDKLMGPLISPATFGTDEAGQTRKKREFVELVHFLMLDFDDVPPSTIVSVLNLVESLKLAGFAYSTWKQPQASAQGLARVRLMLALSRPCTPLEWPAVYGAAVARFGASATDTSCSDPGRFYFIPALPIGCESHATLWTSQGREAWDVDAAVAATPALVPVPLEARDPIPRDALVRLAAKLAKSNNSQRLRVGQLLRTSLDGHRIAEPGTRHVALRDMAWHIAEAFPAGSAFSIVEHLRLALDFMRDEGVDSDPVKHFEGLIESAQRKQHDERERKRLERATDKRPTIVWGAGRLEDMANRAIEALGPLDVFQRSGVLCHVTREAAKDRVQRPDGAPTIRDLPQARLRELLDRVVRFEYIRDDGAAQTIPPPFDLVTAIRERAEWSHIRTLRGIVSFPIMRPDGTLLTTAGYDAATATLSSTSIAVSVPDEPTRLDAERAAGLLLELVADFPFADDAARSVWLASLLTPLARAAIDGPVPLTILDANARGSGKSLLGSLVGRIVLGAELPMRTAPESQEEWRKFLFAIVLAGDPLVLIDNVTRMVQSAALDSILTSTTYGDRVLGVSQDRSVPVRTSFMLSSNNARLSSDLVRRSLHCRLESTVERPEHRSGFRFPHILAHVTERRAEYLSAALTILRAYVVAGRPSVPMRAVGSYEAWSRVVAAPLVWLGLPDPASTQDALRDVADVERDDVGALLRAWFDLFPDERGITARELLAAAETRFVVGQTDADSSKRQALRDALSGLFESKDADRLPPVSRLGYRLRTLRGTMIGGLTLQGAGEARNAVALWKVARLVSSAA